MKLTKSLRQHVYDVLESSDRPVSVCEIYRKLHRELFAHIKKEKATGFIQGAIDNLIVSGSIKESTKDALHPSGGMVTVPVYYPVTQSCSATKPPHRQIFARGVLENIIMGMTSPFTSESVVGSCPKNLNRRDVSKAVTCKISRMVKDGVLVVTGQTYSRNGRPIRVYGFAQQAPTETVQPAPAEDPQCGTFYFKHFPVRTLVRDNKTLFNARDIAAILGFIDPESAVADYCPCVTDGMVSATGCSRMIFVSKTGNKYDLVEWLIDVGGKVRTVDPEPSVELQQAIETITALRGRLERIEQTLWPAA